MNRLKLLFDYQDKLLNVKKIHESLDPSARNWDDFKEKLEKAIEKYHEVMNRLGDDDAYVDQPFHDFYVIIEGLKWSYDNQISNTFIRIFDSADESLRETLTDSANDSGDFDRYEEDEYNSDQTRQNIIDDNLFGDIIEDYMGYDTKTRLYNRFLEKTLMQIKKYNEETTEPDFDGNFDEMNVVSNPERDPDEEKNILKLNKIVELIKYVLKEEKGYKEAFNEIVDIVDSLYYSNNLDMDDVISIIKDDILDWVDENYENDWHFVSITEGERDSDATWEAISEESTSELIRSYAGRSEIKNFMDEINDEFENIIDEYNDYLKHHKVPDKINPEDEESGSEYNE